MKALQVVENFLHYEKGQIIKEAKHVAAILASPFAHNTNAIALPNDAHSGASEPGLHPAITSVATASPVKAPAASKSAKSAQ